ncbi:MAG TPA: hypothetical protein VNT99_16825, partial [Methylomirabilota bacterium]|nr:hypothetical protein [Methylomirabilota bacterium]
MNTQKLIALLVGGLAAVNFADAAPAEQNWGQWRGPLGNGVSPSGNPPTEWSETKNVKWKVKIPGKGSSTPIVWDNLVFVQTAVLVPAKNAARLDIAPQFAGLPQQPPAGQQPAEGGRRRGGGGGFGRGEAPKDPHQFTMVAVDRTTGKVAWQKVLREEIPH